jgi:hypothetical protein
VLGIEPIHHVSVPSGGIERADLAKRPTIGRAMSVYFGAVAGLLTGRAAMNAWRLLAAFSTLFEPQRGAALQAEALPSSIVRSESVPADDLIRMT